MDLYNGTLFRGRIKMDVSDWSKIYTSNDSSSPGKLQESIVRPSDTINSPYVDRFSLEKQYSNPAPVTNGYFQEESVQSKI